MYIIEEAVDIPKKRRVRKVSTFEQVKEVIVRELGIPASKVTKRATFHGDLQADSLDVVEIFMAIEDEFYIEIPEQEIEKMRTVKDVVDYIEKEIAKQKTTSTSSPPVPAPS